MERKIKQLTFIVGAIIALSFASLPVASHAVVPQKNGTGSVSLTVSSALTMEIAIAAANQITGQDNAMSISVSPNLIGTGEFTATVTSNRPYSIALGSKQDAANNNAYITTLTDGNGHYINGDCTVTENSESACWGVKLSASSAFSNIPGAPTTFYTNPNPAPSGSPTDFTIGITSGSSIPAGQYTGTLVVTASTAD